MEFTELLTLADRIISDCKGARRNSPATQALVDKLTTEDKANLQLALQYKLGLTVSA